MLNPTPKEKAEMNHQYSEVITSLLLAHYFAEDSDVAIRQCAKRLNKRITDKYVKKILKGFRESKTPFEDLQTVINQIEERFPLESFLAIATIQKVRTSNVTI